jgi:addiction module RelE/StbE family toxin
MKLIYTSTYKKKAFKFLKKHPDLKNKYKSVLQQLMKDYKHPTLNLHKLKGNLNDFWAISLNYEYRIAMLIEFAVDVIYLLDIGTHDEVY